MELSVDDFGRLQSLIHYFEATMGLSDYHNEPYEELQELLRQIEKTATSADGYCARCHGVKLDWAWEMSEEMRSTGGGFWFCPRCLSVYRPRAHGGWVLSRLIASPPMLSKDGSLARTVWINYWSDQEWLKE